MRSGQIALTIAIATEQFPCSLNCNLLYSVLSLKTVCLWYFSYCDFAWLRFKFPQWVNVLKTNHSVFTRQCSVRYFFMSKITTVLFCDFTKTVTVKCLKGTSSKSTSFIQLVFLLKIFLRTFSLIGTPAVNIFCEPFGMNTCYLKSQKSLSPPVCPPLPLSLLPLHLP